MGKNLTILLVSSIISLGALELTLRVLMPERLAFVPALENNSLTYVPNQIQRARHLEWDHLIKINADGFRNDLNLDEIPEKTILVLGDSFPEGYGVAAEDAFPKQLEQILLQAGKRTHVYNAGHAGAGLPSYRRVYQKIFKQDDRIDRVIVSFFVGNDVLTTNTPPDGRLQVGNAFGDGWVYKLKVFLGSQVAIYAVINYIVKTNPTVDAWCKSLGACSEPRPLSIYAGPMIARNVPQTLAFLAAFIEEIRADGREVMLLMIPTREQVSDKRWQAAVPKLSADGDPDRFAMNQRLVGGLRDLNVTVVDFTPLALDHQRNHEENLYFKYDGHLTPQGHSLLAKHLAESVERQWRRDAEAAF